MNYTIENQGEHRLALDSIKKSLAPNGQSGDSATVDVLTEELIAAARAGHISVVPSATPHTLITESEGQTVFDLPFAWPSTADAVLVIKDDVVLKPTADYVVDSGAGTLTYQHDDLEIADELVLDVTLASGAGLAPASLPADRLDADTQAMLAKVSWGAPTVIDGLNAKSRLQLKDVDGDDLSLQALLRITAPTGVTLAIASGGGGTVVDGSGNDVSVKLSPTGKADIQATVTEAGTHKVSAGVTQGSPLVDCQQTVDLTFAGE